MGFRLVLNSAYLCYFTESDRLGANYVTVVRCRLSSVSYTLANTDPRSSRRTISLRQLSFFFDGVIRIVSPLKS